MIGMRGPSRRPRLLRSGCSGLALIKSEWKKYFMRRTFGRIRSYMASTARFVRGLVFNRIVHVLTSSLPIQCHPLLAPIRRCHVPARPSDIDLDGFSGLRCDAMTVRHVFLSAAQRSSSILLSFVVPEICVSSCERPLTISVAPAHVRQCRHSQQPSPNPNAVLMSTAR